MKHSLRHIISVLFAQSNANKQKVLFVIIGIWNTIFGYSVFALLMYLYSSTISYPVILAISYPIGITNSYVFYKIFVFKTSGNIIKEYVKFCVTYLTTFIINLATLPVLVEFLSINIYMAQGFILFASVIVSFVMHKNYTFRESLLKIP